MRESANDEYETKYLQLHLDELWWPYPTHNPNTKSIAALTTYATARPKSPGPPSLPSAAPTAPGGT